MGTKATACVFSLVSVSLFIGHDLILKSALALEFSSKHFIEEFFEFKWKSLMTTSVSISYTAGRDLLICQPSDACWLSL